MLEKIKLLYQAINDEFSVLLDADTEERAKTLVGYLGDKLGYETEGIELVKSDTTDEYQFEAVSDKDYSSRLNRYKTDDELRDAYEDACDDSCYLIDGFSRAAIGITQDNRVVYDFDAMMGVMMDDDGMEYDEALEYYDYNIARALPYYVPGPVILRHD